jgi:hypothetical protein
MRRIFGPKREEITGDWIVFFFFNIGHRRRRISRKIEKNAR